jgi:DNA-binding LacI/PurR family transcriptional regulator
MARITLEDVANKAGVSFKTVSRVLNNESGVSDATSDRVKKAITELNYVPNSAARTLSRGKARTIGLVIGWPVKSPFISETIETALRECMVQGYSLALFSLESGTTAKVIDAYLGRQVDGLILDTRAALEEKLTCQLKSLNVPCLVIHPNQKNLLPNASFIQIDNKKAAKQAVNYLIELGHRAIGFVSFNMGIMQEEERVMGYKEAILEAGLPINKDWIHTGEGNSGFKLGFSGTMQLLSKHQEITALFSETDEIALGSAAALAQMGLKVPDDISIVGFDDILYASMIVPPLTTIHQPIEEFVKIAVEHLTGWIDGTIKERIDIVMPTKLVVRETCKPPRQAELKRAGAAQLGRGLSKP